MESSLTALLHEALARACAAPEGYHRAVGTDADGTLWDLDVGDTLFLHLGARGDLRGEALATLRARARTWLGEAVPEDPPSLTRALYARYEAGEIPVDAMCALEAEAVGGRDREAFQRALTEVGRVGAERARPAVRELLKLLKSEGFSIHVVSGSLRALVEETLRLAGLPFDSVSGAELREDVGYVTPSLARPIPLFRGKVEALEARGVWPAALGMGDGGWDATFLLGVHVPVLVHPTPALVAAMVTRTDALVLRGSTP